MTDKLKLNTDILKRLSGPTILALSTIACSSNDLYYALGGLACLTAIGVGGLYYFTLKPDLQVSKMMRNYDKYLENQDKILPFDNQANQIIIEAKQKGVPVQEYMERVLKLSPVDQKNVLANIEFREKQSEWTTPNTPLP
ncbi:hypothetical protein A2767_00635 [Candidatus Roizmanbacteria bacterium RIFCSPHIGHO2_01_FULL_35_10]|uniref:Uncharacterized protein n=1 Tax=Candidatus Roizmanbacteria bacterium RIFCSPLOWO2_01_FULL_35_13 TaxID=1802055 RepID=A0A1F7I8Z3_9BACT|nr:MAG: hypothetical protein A2767_00635 [Candidatus Roizmanbacteria bacterium RIFCSPHIGHO2_01_FULL_35_10]OGK39845.1 MAG: hypothetical protein A3A74_03060 [Candidatus Roizmanbacteria bacterium RIFCSPLOWO2_01_FULL_35_13]